MFLALSYDRFPVVPSKDRPLVSEFSAAALGYASSAACQFSEFMRR
jgi:hypothetical protein